MAASGVVARPPDEAGRRAVALERAGQEGERRVAASYRDARSQGGEWLGGDERTGDLGPRAGRAAECRPKAGHEAEITDERKRDRSAVDLRQQQP
jgi:hypothetical protein